MEYPRVKRRASKVADEVGVYANLDELVRLQFKVRGFSFLPRQPIHSVLSGRHASRLRGRGLNFEELRPYLPGDDIRNMDWKATVRTQRPQVRVYTEERDRPVLLLVDQRINMFFGSRRAMKSVVAAEAAALGAWRVLNVGDRVGALVFDDENIVEIKPQRSRETVMQILQAVVEKNHRLRNDPGNRSRPEMLNQVAERAARLAKHDFLIVLISDESGVDEETARWGTILSEHNDILSVFIYDPLEAELPDAGRLVMGEGENQLEIDTSNRRLRQKFRDDFETRVNWLREISRKREIPFIPVSTSEGVAEQVRRVLGHHPPARSV